jgi:hypothetical protein
MSLGNCVHLGRLQVWCRVLVSGNWRVFVRVLMERRGFARSVWENFGYPSVGISQPTNAPHP